MTLHYDDEVRIFKIKCVNRDNNAYVIVDPETREGVIIDAPDEPERILAEVRDVDVKAILITHVHADQLMGLPSLRSQTEAPVWVNVNDAIVFNYFTPVNSERPENPFNDGATLPIGRLTLKAINTPGHTPGSTCYLVGKHLFSGDTLFSSGPGHSANPERLQQCIQSITQKLFVLPDDTIIYPGRGDDTTLTTAKAEYQTFSSRPHPPDLHGEVLWLTS